MQVRASPTRGDFPHTRRRSVRLACCTCTCCCFTFLLGGAGGLVGIAMGLVRAVNTPSVHERLVAAFFMSLVRLVVFVIAYGVAGVCIGAAVGFGIDTISRIF